MQLFFKKALSGLISVAIVTGSVMMVSPVSFAADFKYGDVNSDLVVNSSDALEVLRYSVGKVDFSETALKKADVNGDGKVNSSDALEILKYSVGIISKFKVEESTVTAKVASVAFSRALDAVQNKLPSYVLKETVLNNVEDIKLSGAATKLFTSSKLKELEEESKKDYNIDRTYTKIVKQYSDDSAKKMISVIDLSKEALYKSVECTETEKGTYIISVCFKDEKNPTSASLIVKATGLNTYDEAIEEVKGADEVGGAKSTVDSFVLTYENCSLKCEIDKETDEFLNIEWSADIKTESTVTTTGLTVYMKTFGQRSSSYSNFGY